MPSAVLALLAGCGAPASGTPARTPSPVEPAADPGRIALRIDTGQAEAVLAIVEAANAEPEASWRRLLDSEGHRRLAAREASMQRAFPESELRAFVLSPELAARAQELRATLARWSALDLRAAAARVLVYLPAEARIEATVFPVIKPKPNSFVYFADGKEPSIFIHVDPAMSDAELASTIAHELHHIGFASLPEEPCSAPPPVCTARKWTGAFAEGFAMLAAAGGPDVHPHAGSKPEDRARWDRDVARFDEDLVRVEELLRAVLAGTLDEATAQRRAMEFFGVQGPWYTVGWTMAVAIERCLGRAELVRAMRRPWSVPGRFNHAIEHCPAVRSSPRGATWDPALVERLD